MSKKSLSEKFVQFNEERKSRGLNPVSYEEWRTEYRHNNSIENEVLKIIEYLDLNIENPNVGTKNKQRIMVRALTYMKEWQTGTYENWIHRLSLRLNVTVRTLKENYVDPLISEGIIMKHSSQIFWVGLPEEVLEDE